MSGHIDKKNRARLDPMQRARDFPFLTREQRVGARSMASRLQGIEAALNDTMIAADTDSPAFLAVTRDLPEPEIEGYGKVFIKKNDAALDTINVTLTDENNEPITVALNTLATGDVRIIAKSSGFVALNSPRPIFVDEANGYAYVGEAGSGHVEKIDLDTGTSVQTFVEPLGVYAGKVGGTSSGSGTSPTLQFNNPVGVATASSDVFVADRGNNRAVKMTSSGVYTTHKTVSNIVAITTDGLQIYTVAQSGADTVVAAHPLTLGATVWTYAFTNYTVYAVAVMYGRVYALAKNSTNTNFRFLTISTAGATPSTIGSFTVGSGTTALSTPSALVPLSHLSQLAILDSSNARVTIVSPAMTYMTHWGVAGSGIGELSTPTAMAVQLSIARHLVIANSGNDRIQAFTIDGQYMRTYGSGGTGNGQFADPKGLWFLGSNTLYVADSGNHRVQWLTTPISQPVITGVHVAANGDVTVVDSGTRGIVRFNAAGAIIASKRNVVASSSNGEFRNALGELAVDGTGRVYITDTDNHRVQRFSSALTYQTQWGTAGSDDGQFVSPYGIALDDAGNVYVGDKVSNRIQRFDADGVHLATMGSTGSSDGQFVAVAGLFVDTEDRLWVADAGNDRIQVFGPDLKFLGKAGISTSGQDNTMDMPYGVAITAEAQGYVTNAGNGKISKVLLPSNEFLYVPDDPQTGDIQVYSGGAWTNASPGELKTILGLDTIAIYQDADYTGSNSSSAQKVFNESANGAATVAASTLYEITASIHIDTTGTTSRTFSFGFGGTATLTSIGYAVSAGFNTTDHTTSGGVAQSTGWYNSASMTQIVGNSGANAGHYTMQIKGLVRVNAGGTLIPQFQFSVAPGVAPVTRANSYLTLTPLGSNTVTTIGSWS